MVLDLLKGSAVVAFIVGFWDKIKAALWMMLSTFLEKVEIKGEDAHDSIVAYLITNYEKSSSYDKVFGAKYEYFRNGRYGLVPYEKFGSTSIVFFAKRKFLKILPIPFYFSNTNPKKGTAPDNPESDTENEKTHSYILCLRSTVDFEEILKEAVLERNHISWNLNDKEEVSTRFNLYFFPEREYSRQDKHSHNIGYVWYKQNQYKIIGVTQEELGREIMCQGRALENLFFPEEVKNLIEIISLWVKSKDWYKEKGIPWKRGWLLYGPPGTGKTALARAFAEDLNMPIYLFSIGQLSNSEFIRSWQSMQLNIPCIALIEDIDNVFDKRKNISQYSYFPEMDQKYDNNRYSNEGSASKSPLTFDTLINCIDGVDKSDGIFTIVTTNDISKIDPAIGVPIALVDGVQQFISSRPGRIDKAIHLTYMTKQNKIEMARKILGEFPGELSKVLDYIELELEETPAQFQEYCSQIALNEYWKLNKLNGLKTIKGVKIQKPKNTPAA